MKIKLISLILALATLFALTACGNETAKNDESDEPKEFNKSLFVEVSENSSDTTVDEETFEEPKSEPFIFAGEWVPVKQNSNSTYEPIVITEEGVLVTKERNYTAKNLNPVPDEEGKVKVNFEAKEDFRYYNKQYMFYLKNDGNYCMNKIGDSSDRTYFRESDYADYDVVELTKENVTDYIEAYTEFGFFTNSYGFITSIDRHVKHRFKEGLGMPSYAMGDFIYNLTYKNVLFNPQPNDYIVGETVKAGTDTYSNVEVTQYGWCDSFYSTTLWGAVNRGEESVTKEMSFYELSGADIVMGKVYVPKDWKANT